MWPFKKMCFANWKICALIRSVAVAHVARRFANLRVGVYKLETGEVFGFSPEAGQFVSLRERAPESTAPARDWIWLQFENGLQLGEWQRRNLSRYRC